METFTTIQLILSMLVVLVPVHVHSLCEQKTVTASTVGADATAEVFPAYSLLGPDREVRVEVASAGPVRIQLLQSATALTDDQPYYDIVLGTDNMGAFPGASGSSIAIYKVTGAGPPSPFPATNTVGNSLVTPPLSSNAYTNFIIGVTSAGAVVVKRPDGTELIKFAEDNNRLDVFLVGVTGDGDYRVCDSPNSLAIDSGAVSVHPGDGDPADTEFTDGVISTCPASIAGEATVSGYVLYLDGEYEVFGIQIVVGVATTNLDTAQIRVGNCGYVAQGSALSTASGGMISDNVECGDPLSGDPDTIFHRRCPSNTYGSFIYITRQDATAVAMGSICEIIIYGSKRTDRTTVSFMSPTDTAMEPDSGSDTKTIMLTRSGQSADNPTCTIARVYSSSSSSSSTVADPANTCVFGDDIAAASLLSTADPLIVTFEPGEPTKAFDLMICGDFQSENSEVTVLTFEEMPHTAAAGTTPALTLTITDIDPDYYFSKAEYSGVEGDDPNNVEVAVTIMKVATTLDSTMIKYTMSNGDSGITDDGDDLTLLPDPVQFTTNSMSEEVTLTIIGDMIREGDGSFDLEITDVNGNPLSSITAGKTSLATVTITDNEPLFKFSSAAYEVVETTEYIPVEVTNTGSTLSGGTVTITASAMGADPATHAIEGSDYQPFTMDVTFDPGEKSKLVQVPITNDVNVEMDETFLLTLSVTEGTQLGTPATAVLTIKDDDATVSMSDAAKVTTERDGTVEVVINRDGYTERSAWVDILITRGSASAPSDYTVPNTLRVYFDDNRDTTSITIPIVNDQLIEMDEIFTVSIGGADTSIDSTKTSTVVTVKSDDATIILENSPDEIVEGEIFVATLTRTGGEGFEHVVYVNTNSDASNSNGATAVTDFQVISMPIVFSGTDTMKTVNIQTMEDILPEETESFRVSLSDPNGVVDTNMDSLIVNILDDDALIGFKQLSYTTTESTGSDSTVTVTLTRGGGTTNPLNVYVSTVAVNNAATAGTDFIPQSTQLVTFLAGRNEVTHDITIKADSTSEFAEAFQVIVRSDASGGLVDIDPNRNTANINIVDDDSGSFRLETTAYSVDESQGVVNVKILRPGATAGYVDLLVTISPGTATYPDDYLQESVSVQFSPGQEEANVQVSIAGDNDMTEGVETFLISLSVQSNFGTVDPAFDQATVTIRDSLSSFSLSTTTPKVIESEPGYAEVTIRRTGSSNVDAQVSVRTVDGTATHSGDFKGFNPKTFSFPSGMTELTFKIYIDDNDFQEDSEEYFTVYIVSDDGLIIEDTALVITIADDDAFYSFARTDEMEEDSDGGEVVIYRTSEESGTVTITVQRTGNTNGYGSVRATTSSAGDTLTAEDYIAQELSVINFLQTSTTAEFTITLLNDDKVEGDEAFYIDLSLPTNGAIQPPRRAKVIIGSNDGTVSSPGNLQLSSTAIIIIASSVGGFVVIIAITCVIFAVLLRGNQTPTPRVSGQRASPQNVRPGFQQNFGQPQYPPQLYQQQYRGY